MQSNLLLCYKEYTGAEFNKAYEGIKLYKFLNNDLKHFDFTYKVGLNIDTEQFNPTDKCSKGGLYFCEESKCYFYCSAYGTKMALIEIPDDARVYVEKHKFKTDRLIIKEITDFCDNDDSYWLDILPNNYAALEFIKNQTEELCMTTIKQYSPCALRYAKNQTDKMCKLAVNMNPFMLRYVKEQYQTNEICKLAIQQNSLILKYVINQTEELCILAVQKNGNALEYVKEQYQTEEICKLAIQQNSYAQRYVINQTDELCILAVKQNGLALQFVKMQTAELCILAVQQDNDALHYVKIQFNTDINMLYDNVIAAHSEKITDDISEFATIHYIKGVLECLCLENKNLLIKNDNMPKQTKI